MGRRAALTPELLHFLLTGCYHGAGLEIFALAGAVLRGDLDGLGELWAIHGQAVKARPGGGPLYAEVMLAGGKWQSWPCAEHTERTTA